MVSVSVKIGIIGGVVVACFVGALLFYGIGDLSSIWSNETAEDYHGKGNGLLALGIIIAVVAVVVVLLIAWKRGETS